MTNKKLKSAKPDDLKPSPEGRTSVNSDGFVFPSPNSELDKKNTNDVANDDPNYDELADLEAAVKATPDGRTVTSIFGGLSFKEQIALLSSLPISKKLKGIEPLSEDDLNVIRSNKHMEKFANQYAYPNQEYQGVKSNPFDFPSPADKSMGFHPTSDNFLPRKTYYGKCTFRTSHKNPYSDGAPTPAPSVSFNPAGAAYPSPSTTAPQFAGQPQMPPSSTPHTNHNPAFVSQQHPTGTIGGGHGTPQNTWTPSFGTVPPGSTSQGSAFTGTVPLGFVPPCNNYPHSSPPVGAVPSGFVPPAPSGFMPPNATYAQGGPSVSKVSSVSVPSGHSTNRGGLPTGFAFRPARPDATYEADRVIVSHYNRGSSSNEKERAKIREICTKSIQPLLENSSIKQLLTSDETMYDIAQDAPRWQDGILNIWQHAVAYDFRHVLMIPSFFDLLNSQSIPPNATFINAVLAHDRLTDSDYFNWQSFVRRFGRGEELTSDQWFEDKLWKSLGPTLLSEVRSVFHELPDVYKGGISLLRLIIN